MNSREFRRASKQKVKGNLKGSKDISLEMESIYYEWLKYSNITEEQFLKNAEIKAFKIQKIMENEIETIMIGNEYNSEFNIVGKPFRSSSKEENKNFELNISLLLFAIATKLDNAYVNNPKYPEREKIGCDYYYKQIKKFITENFRI